MPDSRAEQYEAAAEEAGVLKSEIVRRALRFYSEANPDGLVAFQARDERLDSGVVGQQNGQEEYFPTKEGQRGNRSRVNGYDNGGNGNGVDLDPDDLATKEEGEGNGNGDNSYQNGVNGENVDEENGLDWDRNGRQGNSVDDNPFRSEGNSDDEVLDGTVYDPTEEQ